MSVVYIETEQSVVLSDVSIHLSLDYVSGEVIYNPSRAFGNSTYLMDKYFHKKFVI